MTRRPGHSQQMPSPVAPARSDPAAWTAGWICALIFLVTLLAYWPALSGGFIWDDNGHVTRTDLRDFTGLFRIWFELGATQQYYPVLHSAFWLEHVLWGDSTLGYHLLNVLLHATAACLFGALLRRLFEGKASPSAGLRAFDPGTMAAGHERRRDAGVAWFAALLFALHPVCVESVAWISEQKNTLSLVFYLCAALAYLRFTDQHRATSYLLATGLFSLALLTKTVTASLPAALLVVFWWQRGRLEWRRDVVPLLPWFALSAVSGLVTAHFERELIGAQGADFALNWVQRGLLAGRVFWFYLAKLAWPADLIFIYPRWTVDASVWGQWLFPGAALALLGVLGWWRHRQRGPLAAALLFAGALFPVLGFVNVFPFVFSYVADHFQYLASLAIFALAGAGLTQVAARLPRAGQAAAGLTLLAGLAALTWAQCGRYRDNLTLYQAILERNPACWLAHNNLATTLTEAGRMEEALPHLEKTLQLRPDYALAENNMGDALTRLNRPLEAIPHFEKAVRLEPRFYQAHNNLGIALMAVDRLPESLIEFERALEFSPKYAEAEHNLGVALARLNRTAEALPHFERAVQLRPGYAEAELSWAIALMLDNRFPEAVPHFEQAVALDPDSIENRSTYGRALMHHGQFEAALPHFEHVLRLNPALAEEQMNLALVLRQLGRKQEAAQHYLEAVRLNPSLANQK